MSVSFLSVAFVVCALLLVFIIFHIIHTEAKRKEYNKIRSQQSNKYEFNKYVSVRRLHKKIGGNKGGKAIFSELYWIEPKHEIVPSNKPKLLYILIPGNPGIATAYIHWFQTFIAMFHQKLDTITQQLHSSAVTTNRSDVIPISYRYSSVSAVVISHANHCRDKNNLNQRHIFRFSQQLQHKIDFLQSIIDSPQFDDNTEVIIGGHSIGAFIALKMLQFIDTQYPRLIHRFRQIHLFAPTIYYIGRSPHGKMFGPIFRYFKCCVLPMVHSLLSTGIIPLTVLRSFLASPELIKPDRILRDLTCPNARLVSNMVNMAQDEFTQVVDWETTDLEGIIGKYCRSKLVFCLADNDPWAPRWQQEWMKEWLLKKNGKRRVEDCVVKWDFNPDLKHNMFIVSPEHKIEEKLSRKMLKWIDL